MTEHRITQQEIIDAMERQPRALPFLMRSALAMADVMCDKGIRYRHRSAMGMEPPELLPPYEAWRDPCTLDIVVRQGPA